ncbi:geobacillin-26 family protein [Heyndrickxia oleronia]|uniref:geobacillin-26 family protein n=1 Tax=Heyndrickxia oleronia TaxID=38875 RepID=UPI00203FB3B4|nr:geobacillin-26 family protein [Heyndrickxia oleronia]MCM3456546.1 geobacillin-26 family protein [Heyndrickxia oleronia]
MKNLKVFLASFLSLLFLVIVPLSQVHAEVNNSVGKEITFNDGITAKTLEDNAEVKRVETKDDKNIYIATYYKKTGELKYETYDLNRKLLNEELITDNPSSKNALNVETMAGTLIRKNTLKDVYGYWVYSYSGKYIWVTKLRDGVSKNPTEKDANRDALNNFKSSVDSFMSNKDQMVVKVGSGVIATIVTLYLVPEPTWTKILAGLLTVISSAIAYAEGKAMYNAYMDSKYYFARITI